MRAHKGFSLIELLIVLAIIGVLAVVATMSYGQYITRANRADAKIELMRIAQIQERYFSNSQPIGYAEDLIELGVLPEGSSPKDSFFTENNHYQIKMVATDSAFELTATAKSARQLRDEECQMFSINSAGKESAANKSGESDETGSCWSR